MQQIQINSHSDGNYRIEQLNGRDHLITSMISIELDSVMNGLFYPREAIEDSYHQLDNLPAPMGHPVVNGENVSANHPLAVNSFNVGAFVMNPRIEGNFVHNDLAIDIMTAEKDDRGIELMRRIKNRERVGSSTGLNAGIINGSGEKNGRKFNGTVSNIEFDHVANLLHEPPAGEHTYTVNSESENTIIICNVEQSAAQKPQAKAPILTKRKGKRMEQENLVNAVIVNSNNNLTESDRETLMGLNENALVSMVCANSKQGAQEITAVTVDEAVSVIEGGGMFAINTDQKALLDGLAKAETEKRDSVINSIVDKSEMTKEQLTNMDMGALESMAKSLNAPVADFSIQGANVTNANTTAGSIQLHEEA